MALSLIEASTENAGSAGKITITASEYIKIVGENSGIFGTSGVNNADATGNAGTIIIGKKPTGESMPVPMLNLSEGGQISTETFGAGEGGEIDININNLEITQGGKIDSSSEGTGSAGKITITASEYIKIFGDGDKDNNSGIFSTTSNTGNAGQINKVADFNQAGNIIIGAHQLDMSNSTISTSSTNADGGNILIGVRELNNKRITDSEIAATAGETGIGGNLEIRGPKYLILDSTDLKADADKGGNLTLDADVFIASSDSQIEASGVLQTPEHIDVGTISLLPNQGVDVSKMVKECTAYDSEEEWSLKQVGYGERKKGCIK